MGRTDGEVVEIGSPHLGHPLKRHCAEALLRSGEQGWAIQPGRWGLLHNQAALGPTWPHTLHAGSASRLLHPWKWASPISEGKD